MVESNPRIFGTCLNPTNVPAIHDIPSDSLPLLLISQVVGRLATGIWLKSSNPSPNEWLGMPFTMRIIFATIALVRPLFFAGIIFAITFSQTQSIESALGSNLIGSVVGGVSEYLSLVTGIRDLYLLALIFYILAAWGLPQRSYRSVQLPQ